MMIDSKAGVAWCVLVPELGGCDGDNPGGHLVVVPKMASARRLKDRLGQGAQTAHRARGFCQNYRQRAEKMAMRLIDTVRQVMSQGSDERKDRRADGGSR